MRCFPQGADLLFLPLGRKDVLLHTQLKNVLEVFNFGIVAAGFPLADGTAGDHQQLEHDLPEGIVALLIGVPRHRRTLCLPRGPAAPS